jgi:hypothetical protein
LHPLSTRFVPGINGCGRCVFERLIAGESFEPSDNNYDCLDGEFTSGNQTCCGDMNSRLSSTANGSGLKRL